MRHFAVLLFTCLVAFIGGLAVPRPVAGLFVTATPSPVPSPLPSALPSVTPWPSPQPSPTSPPLSPTPLGPASVQSYVGYRVKTGDTLASIAARGGSSAILIRRYNRLQGVPQVGRELMIPVLRPQESRIPFKEMMVLKGNTAQPWVALTLDCGNSEGRLPGILDTLRAYDVQGPFFLVGNVIEQYPDVVQRLVREGHELANHSYSHPDFTKLSEAAILAELRRNERSIGAILDAPDPMRPFFRFPYGTYDMRVLETVIGAGYLPIHWGIDVLDTVGEPKSAAFVTERLLAIDDEELPATIVLAHCTQAVAEALPSIIEGYAARGYELRTLSEVLGP
ncbi:polysaccharide deacetylase family protein [Candidatus Gracilibacteria bacterium]|nr:polysaccharide deacetylase family protein [Candidatus Gracilibacteria bacterium]